MNKLKIKTSSIKLNEFSKIFKLKYLKFKWELPLARSSESIIEPNQSDARRRLSLCVKQTNCQCPNGDPRLCLLFAFSSWPASINCVLAAIILGRRGSRSICQDGGENLIDLRLSKLVQFLIRSELRREPKGY